MGRPQEHSMSWDYVLMYHERDHGNRIKCATMYNDRGNGFYYAVVDKFNHFVGFVQARNKTGALFAAKSIDESYKLYGQRIGK